MYEVWVWVPTKGWKRLKGFRSRVHALEMAHELEPLEVKVRQPEGPTLYGGEACMPDHTLGVRERTI